MLMLKDLYQKHNLDAKNAAEAASRRPRAEILPYSGNFCRYSSSIPNSSSVLNRE